MRLVSGAAVKARSLLSSMGAAPPAIISTPFPTPSRNFTSFSALSKSRLPPPCAKRKGKGPKDHEAEFDVWLLQQRLPLPPSTSSEDFADSDPWSSDTNVSNTGLERTEPGTTCLEPQHPQRHLTSARSLIGGVHPAVDTLPEEGRGTFYDKIHGTAGSSMGLTTGNVSLALLRERDTSSQHLSPYETAQRPLQTALPLETLDQCRQAGSGNADASISSVVSTSTGGVKSNQLRKERAASSNNGSASGGHGGGNGGGNGGEGREGSGQEGVWRRRFRWEESAAVVGELGWDVDDLYWNSTTNSYCQDLSNQYVLGIPQVGDAHLGTAQISRRLQRVYSPPLMQMPPQPPPTLRLFLRHLKENPEEQQPIWGTSSKQQKGGATGLAGKAGRTQTGEKSGDVLGGTHLVALVCSSSAALAIVEEGHLTHHKVITAYTVRAKQGKSQLRHLREGGSGGRMSAGGALRAQQTRRLFSQICQKLQEWQPMLASCTWLFSSGDVRVWNEVYACRSPELQVKRDDPRWRHLPFHVNLPRHSELCRVLYLISHGHCGVEEIASPVSASKFQDTKILTI